MRICQVVAIALVASTSLAASAETPVINSASVVRTDGLWDFTATISHKDKGWGDYVTAWRILDPSGHAVGVRELHIPHDGGGTRTRALSGVSLNDDITFVEIEVRDSMLGWGGDRYRLQVR